MTDTTARPTRSFSSGSTLSLPLTRTSTIQTFDELKLSHILNGETCPPISFPDFASFVTHKEFSTENLLFVIWFRSYQSRFNTELSDKQKYSIPKPSTKLGDRYNPFGYLDKAIADGVIQSRSSTLDSHHSNGSPIKFQAPFSNDQVDMERLHFDPDQFKPCSWTMEGKSCNCGKHKDHTHPESGRWAMFGGKNESNGDKEKEKKKKGSDQSTVVDDDRLRSILHTSLHPSLPPIGTVLLSPEEQPMREEAERAFATFLKKGGSRELGISDDLRQFAKDTLKRSTAPECFLPVFEEVYHVVETQSLPHFLSYAKTNINRPKQLFWYYVGATDFMIGVIIFLLITLFVPQYNFGYRAARLPAALFTCFGSMQFYSASKGFCTQVWGRSSRQIRPWELDELTDEETTIGGRDIIEDLNGSPTTRDVEKVDMVNEEMAVMPIVNCDLEISLPDGVQPLGDVSGITSSTSMNSDLRGMAGGTIDFLPTEVQLKQLNMRRATVKVPAAELAFPIMESPTPIPTSTIPIMSNIPIPLSSPEMDRRKRSEISPFEDIAETAVFPVSASNANNAINNTQDASGEKVKQTPSGSQKPTSPIDLNTLLVKIKSAEPKNLSVFKSREAKREKQTKIFGPEKLIEDPRVKKLMEKVIRDILLVGGAAALITVALCFAVPMRL